ncbi:hypothetical protein BWI96_11695 [Siphonobacter sp. SORGH_AS_0500]|uniref:hypothetical protein n=1 Tax=Siphonobacter sp. SORGH_AS_0500 TaxID=1864824 RepID=UPI000CC0BFAC|nr:hypothetical protein [Siphonobacter sp. SORGH_AS_0500]PKK36511.1 hypothetical protein BWI96_11695 [Siphonobacter sp. SORGH_AS_0500]
MNWQANINTIREIYPGHFQIIIDFATNAIIKHLIREDYSMVWVHHHQTFPYADWHSFELPVAKDSMNLTVKARQVNFDFILPTPEFLELLPTLDKGINLVQLNRLPPAYLDPQRIQGKTRYDLLKRECDYLFELYIPSATDYGTLVSHERSWLESLLTNSNINWKDLP